MARGQQIDVSAAADGSLAAFDAADAERWARGARSGEILVYARNFIWPTQRGGADRLRALRDAGAVRTHHLRANGRGPLLYIAIRTEAPIDAAAVETAAREGQDDASVETAALYRLLSGAARRGDPCPSNRALAETIGAKDGLRVSYLMRGLRAAGEIAVRGCDAEPKRIVTIVKTGRETGVRDGVAHNGFPEAAS